VAHILNDCSTHQNYPQVYLVIHDDYEYGKAFPNKKFEFELYFLFAYDVYVIYACSVDKFLSDSAKTTSVPVYLLPINSRRVPSAMRESSHKQPLKPQASGLYDDDGVNVSSSSSSTSSSSSVSSSLSPQMPPAQGNNIAPPALRSHTGYICGVKAHIASVNPIPVFGTTNVVLPSPQSSAVVPSHSPSPEVSGFYKRFVCYDGTVELNQKGRDPPPVPGLYLANADVNNAALFMASFLSGYVLPYLAEQLRRLSRDFGKPAKWSFLVNKKVEKYAEGTRFNLKALHDFCKSCCSFR
jgi:hypothetical protein